jgi:hypothetical protein
MVARFPWAHLEAIVREAQAMVNVALASSE